MIFEGASSGLLDDSDLADAASVVEPGSSAAILLVREPLGYAPFTQALRRGGAEVVAAGYVPLDAHRGVARCHRTADRLIPPERTSTMPGLLRGVARTAVVAGTATTVSNRVSRRQANRWAAPGRPAVPADSRPQQQYAPPPPPPRPVAAPAPDPIAQLKELAELKAQGILTDEEFAAQKAKILASDDRQGGCHALPVPASADVMPFRRPAAADGTGRLQPPVAAGVTGDPPGPGARPRRARAPLTTRCPALRELAQLHESGALTDDEFTVAKAKLLGRRTRMARDPERHRATASTWALHAGLEG